MLEEFPASVSDRNKIYVFILVSCLPFAALAIEIYGGILGIHVGIACFCSVK